MTFVELFAHDWKTRFSCLSTQLGLALFALVLFGAAAHGQRLRQVHRHAIAQHRRDVSIYMKDWLHDLESVTADQPDSNVPPWAGSPMDAKFSTYLPPGSLSDLAIGQSDLLPYTGEVSLWDPDIRLFSKYTLDDPVALARGAFDSSQAILLLLPIFLIILSFDLVSAERDSGRLTLIAAQGTRLRALFWRKLGLRCSLVLAIAILVPAGTALMNDGSDPPMRWFALGLWIGGTVLYGIFWAAVVAFIASGRRSSEANILWLLLLWVGLTSIVPAGISTIAEAIDPTPSRAAYLTEARELEVKAERTKDQATRGFLLDHPEVLVDDQSAIPEYVRTAFLVTSVVDEATLPLLRAFEETASRRAAHIDRFRYLSPSVILHAFFLDLAGTSSKRHRRYQAAVRSFKDAWAKKVGPSIIAGHRLPLDVARNLPEFTFEDETLRPNVLPHIPSLLFVGWAAAMLFWMADRQLKKTDSRNLLNP